MRLAAVALAALCGIAAADCPAHEVRPALLDVRERPGGRYDVVWKVPKQGDRALALAPVLPPSLEPAGPALSRPVAGAWLERRAWRGPAGALVGARIQIEGLASVQTDVLLRVELANGDTHSAVLRPDAPSFVVPERAGRLEIAKAYGRMGTTHILEGADHLLFLLALLWIVEGVGPLLKTVTAFTVAHSLTLALATLGFVHVPAAPTEAIISLSIVFLAAEIVRKHEGEVGLAERRPWLVALAFGLFHGLGFAGALSEVGVPAHEVPLALLFFNVGVEIGQVAFVLAAVAAFAGLRRAGPRGPAGTWRLAPYAIGAIASFWTIERLARAFGGPT
jgi:hypothetical protein